MCFIISIKFQKVHGETQGKCVFNYRIITMLVIIVASIYFGEGNGTHSSTLSWKIPWTEEPGRLQSMGPRRIGQDWATSLSLFTFMHWRRKWQPTPVFMPGESQGWGRTESDTPEVTWQQQYLFRFTLP